MTRSQDIRRGLDHPVVDADGHLIELTPVLLDYVKQVGGPEIAAQLEDFLFKRFSDPFAPIAERRRRWQPMKFWWGLPTGSTLDRITVSLPRLLHERLPEMGLDYAVLYPTYTLSFETLFAPPPEELRRVALRAFNHYLSELFGNPAYADRMTPVALIPMFTPRAAIEELEHCVRTLGMKATLLSGHIRRPIAAIEERCPGLGGNADRLDTFGIDSEHDYDPVWAKCVELKVAPTFHAQGSSWGSRRSPSNFTYNHIGHFAAANEAVCKSLFLGGVTRRFPELRFGFLEGGVGWAASLYADLYSHWEKRNPQALRTFTDPANLDAALMASMAVKYGDAPIAGRIDALRVAFEQLRQGPRPDELDDFAAAAIERPEDFARLFAAHFYFGCEADDPLNAIAFDSRIHPQQAKLKAVLGSDIGHFDVQDMTGVLGEAHELVDKGLCSAADFRDFVFANPVQLYGGLNRRFFDGTVVEREARKLLDASG